MRPDNDTVAKGYQRRTDRQRAISGAVIAEGAVRIEQLAERFNISSMTVHRDLDELEARGLLRKSRGVATALSTSLVESSDVFRSAQQKAEKIALAHAAMDFIEPGHSIILDDSTTVLQMTPLLAAKAPLTVITNVLTSINRLTNVPGISLVALGGSYYNWCSAFMGHITNAMIATLRVDTLVMSTAAITGNTCYHQSQETVDTKRAMLDASARKILLVDHTKFSKRALHALAPLSEFDVVIVDWRTTRDQIDQLRTQRIEVVLAPPAPNRVSAAGPLE